MPTKTRVVLGFSSLRKASEFDLPGYSERACMFGRGTTAAPVSFIFFFSFKASNNQNRGSSRLGISARKEGLAGRENNVLSSLTHVPRCRFCPGLPLSSHVSLLSGAVTADRDCGRLPSGAHRRPIGDPCTLGRSRG